jgi:hypothetical protein
MEPTTSVSSSDPSGGGGGYQATTPGAVDQITNASVDPLGLQSTANNENLNPQFLGGPKLDIGQLLAQVMSITSQDLKEAQDKKLELEKNRLRPALYQVLCELKEKTALNMRQTVDDDPQDPQIARLDNMLMAEGVSGPERSGDAAGGMPLSPGAGPGSAAASSGDSMALEHSDYKQKLSHIREVRYCFLNLSIRLDYDTVFIY